MRSPATALSSMALSSMALWSLVVLAGCPEEPARCGDGEVDPGEDEVSCCLDTGCSLGSCDAPGEDGAPACVLPWEYPCLGHGGECLEGSPLRCSDGSAPPSYDCDACGCGDADACVEGVCYDAATRAGVRDLDVVPDDLELAAYVALPIELRSHDAASIATIAAVHREEPRLDPRRNTFLIGWDTRSPGRDEVAGAWLEALGAGGLPRREADCAPATALWPDGAVTSLLPPARAARVTCAYPGMFVDCVLPTNADCALGQGFLSETAIFLDLDVVLDDADAAMLIRAGRAAPSLRDAALVEALDTWRDAAGTVGAQPGLVVADRFGAAYPSVDPHVTWVLLGARTTAALRLESYRAVWADPPSQQFLVDHDMQTRECTFAHDVVAPGALPDTVTMTCANAGAALTAVLETEGFTIVDVSTTEG